MEGVTRTMLPKFYYTEVKGCPSRSGEKLPAHANYPPLKGEAIGAKNVGMEYYVMI